MPPSPAPLEPFFRVVGEDADVTRVTATDSTAGPWFPGAQHMGPPSALLTRALERCADRHDPAGGEALELARLTVEVLGRVPLGELEVRAAVARAGRTIELVTAELVAVAEGRPVARAAGWFHGVADTAAAAGGAGEPLAPPSTGRTRERPAGWLPGYLDAVDWRWLAGGLDEPGAGAAWGRLRVPVVEGETPSPWQRCAAIADSTNGVGARLDLNEWIFMNTDLTVHLHRAPQGEWVGLDAHGVVGPRGSGTAWSVVHDEQGPVGRAAQALTVRPR